MQAPRPRLSVEVESSITFDDLPNVSENESEGLPIGVELFDFKQQYEINGLRTAQAILREQVDLHDLRKTYSSRLFLLVVVWVATVWGAVLLQGFGGIPGYEIFKFKLSDAVLIAYITSTTASVLGLFGIAAYWLFGTKKPAEAKK